MTKYYIYYEKELNSPNFKARKTPFPTLTPKYQDKRECLHSVPLSRHTASCCRETRCAYRLASLQTKYTATPNIPNI